MNKVEKEIINAFTKDGNGLIKLPFIAQYNDNDELLYVDKKTGLVRSSLSLGSQEILDYWSNVIFSSKDPEDYSALNPFAHSRLLYVLLTIKYFITQIVSKKLSSVKLCDFATGQGVFLNLCRSYVPEVQLSATEASEDLSGLLKKDGFQVKQRALGISNLEKKNTDNLPNFATLSWTLCNCIEPLKVLLDIRNSIAEDAYICVSESSRIMVPFRKMLSDYIPKKHPFDAHPFHFSVKSLSSILIVCGFEPVYYNRFQDSDILLIIAKKVPENCYTSAIEVDDPRSVYKFMSEWHNNTVFFKNHINKL